MTKLALKDPQFANLEEASVTRENPNHPAARGPSTDAELTAIAGHIRDPGGRLGRSEVD